MSHDKDIDVSQMTTNNANGSFQDERQDKFFGLEDKSWWFRYRIEIYKHLADKYFDRSKTLADIGGSNGYNTLKMQEAGWDAVLVEPTPKACENAKTRGVKKVVNSSFEEYADNIPQWFLLEVLEHIKDDNTFVKKLCDQTEKGGVGLIAAVASMALWNSEDEVDGHYRRYSKKRMAKLVEDAGFEILYISYMYQFLWLPHFLLRRCREMLPFVHKVYERTPEENAKLDHKQFDEPSGLVKFVLDTFEKREMKKIKKEKNIPYGSTIMCVVRKK